MNKITQLLFILSITMAMTPGIAISLNINFEKTLSDIESAHPELQHISGDQLLALDKENTLIFDVREKKEFNVSHLKNAIHIDPNITAQTFSKKYAGQLNGKHIVFYCSVGQRSSELAYRLKPLLKTQGIQQVYNLKGGIFQWHNENKTLVQKGKVTQYIHPYNARWGALVKDSKTIRYAPDSSINKN